MKFRVLLIALLICFSSSNVYSSVNLSPASLHLNESGTWTYEKIVEVPGNTKDALYERMKKWVLTNVKSVDQNSLTDDPAHETLITNVTLSIGKLWTLYSDARINFKLVLEFKDNKLRVTANSFSYYALGTSADLGIKDSPLETYKDAKLIIKRINERIDEVFPAFITSVENGSKATSKDW